MKYFLPLLCLCLIVVAIYASPPFGVPDENLAPHCRSPKCPEGKNGMAVQPVNLTYPLDCLLYIACGPETRIESCPSGQVFNKQTGHCDNPQKANCIPCWQQAP